MRRTRGVRVTPPEHMDTVFLRRGGERTWRGRGRAGEGSTVVCTVAAGRLAKAAVCGCSSVRAGGERR